MQTTAKLAPLGYRNDLACRREEATPPVSKAALRVQGHQARLRGARLVRMARNNLLFQGKAFESHKFNGRCSFGHRGTGKKRYHIELLAGFFQATQQT